MSSPSTNTLLPALAALLNKAQKSTTDSRHATCELKDLLKTQPELYTCEQGLPCKIKRLMALAPARKDAGVDRVHALVGQLLLPGLTAPEEDGAPEPSAAAATACLLAVLPLCASNEKNVRLQTCRLALATLTAFAEAPGAAETDLLDAAWSAFRAALLPRLKDKQASVRAAAATALKLLQSDDARAPGARGGEDDGSSSSDNDDEVAKCADNAARDEATLELLQLASGDSSKDVRLAAVSSFQLSSLTLSALVSAARDVAPEVRCGALRRLAAEVDSSHLPRNVRAALAGASLRDRVPAVRACAREMVLGGWLRRANCDPVKLLALLDCAPAAQDADNQGAHERHQGAVAAVCATMLDAAEDYSPGAVLSRGERDTLEHALDTHAINLKVAAADASRACGHGPQHDDDEDGDDKRAAARQRAASKASAAAFALLWARAGRVQKRLKGARKEDALEKLLPEPAAFADLLTLTLGLASIAAVRADDAADAFEEATAGGAKANSPLVVSARTEAKATQHEARHRLAAALCAVRVVPLLDQQDEAGRAALSTALENCALMPAAPNPLVSAAVRGLAHVTRCGGGNGSGGGDFPTAIARLLGEALQHADAAAAEASTAAEGEGEDDEEEAALAVADARAAWDIRRGVVCAAALRAAAPGSLGGISGDRDNEEDDEEEDTFPSSGGEAMSAAGACLEKHLASLLTSDFDDARRFAVEGLGSLALLHPQACRKWLRAIVNVVLCRAEAPEVRTAALHALSDLCHTSDDTAAALADASACGTLPDATAWLASSAGAAAGATGGNGDDTTAVAAPFFMRVLCALLDGEKADDGDEEDEEDGAAPVVPQLAAAAAEAGAKLLLAQRLRSGPAGDAASPAECGLLLSRLVALYFRSAKQQTGSQKKEDAEAAAEDASAALEEAVGAASRAQQVLSVFFPAFAREPGSAAVLQAGLDSFLANYTAAASSALNVSGEATWSPLRGACTVSQAVLFFVALFDSANASPKPHQGEVALSSSASNAAKGEAATAEGEDEDDEEAKESEATSADAQAPGSPEAPLPSSLSSSSSSRGSWRLQASLKLSGLLVNHRAWAGPKNSASSTARKQLAKALSTMPVMSSDDNNDNSNCDVELLKLCGLWSNMAMQAVTQLDGAAAAKPIAKFVAAVRAADPRPEGELPAEFKFDASLEILVANPLFGGAVGAEKLATLLAGSSSEGAEDTPSSIRSRPRKSNASKRQSLKEESSSSEESDDSDDAAEDDESENDFEEDAGVANAENDGAGNSEAAVAVEATSKKAAGNKTAPGLSKTEQKSALTEESGEKRSERRPLKTKA